MPVQFNRPHPGVIPQDDPLLDTPAAAIYADLSVSTMNKKRLDGSGPVYYKIGRCVRYRKSDLDHWLNHCRVNSTTEAQAKAAALP